MMGQKSIKAAQTSIGWYRPSKWHFILLEEGFIVFGPSHEIDFISDVLELD